MSMDRKTAIDTLSRAFERLNKTEFQRLVCYKNAGKEFLCGPSSALFCLDGKG